MRRVLLPDVDPAGVRVPAGEVVRLSGPTMGVGWRVSAVPPPQVLPAALAARVQARLDALVMQMSPWEAASDISRFNRAARGVWIDLPEDFAAVMGRALHWARVSGGAFDPTLGRLVDLWGFGPPGAATAPPDAAGIAQALAQAGWTKLALLAGADRLRQPGGLSLDLSGIAKGYAVDAVAELLAEAGVTDFLVEIGGECRGAGVKPGGEPWWVALEAPLGAGEASPIIAGLYGLAVATSGEHARRFVHEGRAYDHTLDGRTGRPAESDVVQACVVGASAMDADAAATVLMTLRSEAGLAFADAHGLAARLFVRTTDGVEERLSPAFARMLDD